MRVVVLGLFVCFLGTVFAADPPATHWPQWRGPNRDDNSTSQGLLKGWPKEGPKLLWEAKGAGRGYASVVIANGRVVTMGDAPSTAADNAEYVQCFDEATGKSIWSAKVGDPWKNGQESWQSSRSTPTIDGDRVYALSAFGKLVCFDFGSGKEIWRKDLAADFKGKKGDGWGYSESVLIDGDQLICTPGSESHTMVALNKLTGELIWASGLADVRGAGHASAMVSQIGKTKVYVQTTASGAMGVRASDGKLLWSYPIDKTTAVIPSPIVRGDLVFFTAGYGRGGALLRQVADGDGVKVEEVYPLNTDLKNKHGGVVLVGDYLYGDTDDGGIPYCAEFLTGKQKWKQRGSGQRSAAVTYADGHLYFRFSDGTLALVPASPKGYEEVSTFKIPHSGERPSWSHPVVAGGKLFLREGDYILCYDLKQP